MFIYFLRERERAHACARVSGGGAERQGERESQAGSMLSAKPDMGLDPRTVRSRPERIKSRTLNLLSHPDAPPPPTKQSLSKMTKHPTTVYPALRIVKVMPDHWCTWRFLNSKFGSASSRSCTIWPPTPSRMALPFAHYPPVA